MIIMMIFHYTKKTFEHSYITYTIFHKLCYDAYLYSSRILQIGFEHLHVKHASENGMS